MLEEAIPWIWASVYSFFTPTVLFVLLNVVIGTIAVTSKGICSPHHHDAEGGAEPGGNLRRTSSAVLERIRSFNLYRHIPAAEHPIETAPHHHHGEPGVAEPGGNLGRTSSAVLDRLRSFNLYRHIPAEHPIETAPPPPAPTSAETLEIPPAPPSEPAEHHQFSRSQSDAQPTAGEMPQKLAGKMKKSASSKSAFAHFEESDIVRRSPAPAPAPEEEEEVDARANDFINRFRQQLNLQRLESFKRYKEMLQRGR